MIREYSSPQSRPGSMTYRRLPGVALLAATTLASIMACSSDDDTNTEVLPLESIDAIDVPERDLPAAPPPEVGAAPEPGGDTPNGLSLPGGILDWRVLGVVNIPAAGMAPATVRAIVGNDTAVDAARAGNISPWPDGSMIAHYQWSPGSNPDWDAMIAPDDFLRLTLMVKNAEAYAADGGWAYGVWGGDTLTPPAVAVPPDAPFDRACVTCHTNRLPPESGKDYVFTVPGPLPTIDAVQAAPVLSNGIELPAGILDWRVIGVASRETDDNPNIRVIVGNDAAVEAARSGETNPWPDGAMLAHYVWGAGENPDVPGATSAVSFSGITLMVKNAEEYAADGGWAYGNWNGADLTAPELADFDRDCVDCHTANVAENDYVFTRPGALPTDMFEEMPQAL